MLWLKAWLETRWRVVWVLFMGLFLLGVPLEISRSPRVADPQRLLSTAMGIASVLLSFFTAMTLAGSGIQTASTRPGASDKSAEKSTLFTLSLPVTRAGLFAVRTVTGVLETIALLVLFAVVAWLLVPSLAANAPGALGYFAVIVSFSVAAYAMSAFISTFCDEGWRFRVSGLCGLALTALAINGRLPRSADILRPLLAASPLVTHRVPWETIAGACLVAALFLAMALVVIQRREY